MRIPKNVVVLFTLLLFSSCSNTEKPGPDISHGEHNQEKIILHDLHNNVRSSKLIVNDKLMDTAQKHADYMALYGMSHSGYNGSSIGDRIIQSGYNYSSCGENIAEGYITVESVFDGWMRSPGHKRNILNTNYKDVGYGIASSNNRVYWCVVFARPR